MIGVGCIMCGVFKYASLERIQSESIVLFVIVIVVTRATVEGWPTRTCLCYVERLSNCLHVINDDVLATTYVVVDRPIYSPSSTGLASSPQITAQNHYLQIIMHTGMKLEEASTHKSAKTHAGSVFFNCDP